METKQEKQTWARLNTSIFKKLNKHNLAEALAMGKMTPRWTNFLMPESMIEFLKNEELLFILHTILQTNTDDVWVLSRIWNMAKDNDVSSHSILQNSIVRNFWKFDLKEWIINYEDYTILRILALIHDIWEIRMCEMKFAEGKVIPSLIIQDDEDHKAWDIIREDKKDWNIEEELEKQNWIKWLRKILEWFSEKEIEKILEVYEINFDKNHRLHEIFKSYERISYLNGALIAMKSISNEKPVFDVYKLMYDVIRYQIPWLYNDRNNPSVIAFILANWNEITMMFYLVERSWYKDKNIEQFQKAKQIWENEFIPFIIWQSKSWKYKLPK